jgi:hypothetical protein
MNGHINAQLRNSFRNSFTESFERVCHTVLISGYNMALDDDKYDIDWKENSFTNYLASFMRKHKYVEQYYIFIKVQAQKDNNNLPIDEDDPDKQPIIDLWLANWNHIGKNEYFIEAKNLSENDWQKKSGSTVEASKQRGRYIDTGIHNFVSGRYPFGCLVGYIVQGKARNILNKLNKLLRERCRKAELLKQRKVVDNFKTCYISTHLIGNNSIHLKHIFLDFVTA